MEMIISDFHSSSVINIDDDDDNIQSQRRNNELKWTNFSWKYPNMDSCNQSYLSRWMYTQHWTDPHITTARIIRITFISSIYVFKNMKSFSKLFFLCSRNATGGAFEMLFPASMCVTCFQRASPGRPRPLAGWLRWQQTQAEPSWAASGWAWHYVLTFLGSAETWQPRNPVLCFCFAGGRGTPCFWNSGHYSWPVWEQRQLPLQRATSSPHHLEHLKVMPSFGDVGEKQVWRNLAVEGNKDIYLCYPCNSIYLFAWKKKNYRNCPLTAKIQFHWNSYKCSSPPQLKKNKIPHHFYVFCNV